MRGNVDKSREVYSVQAVLNAMNILEALGKAPHELSISDLYEMLDMSKSNINKLLATLAKFNYVDNNPYTGNFRLGVKTFQISQAYIGKLNLADVAFQAQKTLADTINESVYISVLHKEIVVYLSVIETKQVVRVVPKIGNIGPAYATAAGKIQLAFMGKADVEQLYPGAFEAFTPKTIQSMPALLEELVQAHVNRYAIDYEECDEGVICIAMPILNFMGRVIGAMSISAPAERMSDARIKEELLPELKKSADALSTTFGYSAISDKATPPDVKK